MGQNHFDKLLTLRKGILSAPAKLRAETPTDVLPELVDPLLYGHHRSVVIHRGDVSVRVWEFRNEAGIRKFQEHVKRGLLRRKA